MKRVIFSIYINIPQDELDWQPPYPGETESKNDKTKREFDLHKDWLINRQQEYANDIGVEYKLFTNDQAWDDYKADYQKRFPFLTTYNIVNFYKIHLMYQLKEEYDEILYMDLDVVPVTKVSFFDSWDLSEGIAIKKNVPLIERTTKEIKLREESFLKGGYNSSIRSPTAKFWNSKAMIIELGDSVEEPPVFNTGIVGITKAQLEQLDYFANFEENLEIMSELKEDEFSFWPKYIQNMFGWDNETLWGVKYHMNKLDVQWLDGRWHYFMDRMNFIPIESKFVHVINKEFKFVRDWYEENCI